MKEDKFGVQTAVALLAFFILVILLGSFVGRRLVNVVRASMDPTEEIAIVVTEELLHQPEDEELTELAVTETLVSPTLEASTADTAAADDSVSSIEKMPQPEPSQVSAEVEVEAATENDGEEFAKEESILSETDPIPLEELTSNVEDSSNQLGDQLAAENLSSEHLAQTETQGTPVLEDDEALKAASADEMFASGEATNAFEFERVFSTEDGDVQASESVLEGFEPRLNAIRNAGTRQPILLVAEPPVQQTEPSENSQDEILGPSILATACPVNQPDLTFNEAGDLIPVGQYEQFSIAEEPITDPMIEPIEIAEALSEIIEPAVSTDEPLIEAGFEPLPEEGILSSEGDPEAGQEQVPQAPQLQASATTVPQATTTATIIPSTPAPTATPGSLPTVGALSDPAKISNLGIIFALVGSVALCIFFWGLASSKLKS